MNDKEKEIEKAVRNIASIVNFVENHNRGFNVFSKKENRKNKYLKRIKNRQVLYMKRKALGRI